MAEQDPAMNSAPKAPDSHETHLTHRAMTLRERVAAAAMRVYARAQLGIASVYIGAAGLIGIEGLALMATFTTAWPLAIPPIIGAVALIFVMRERIRGARQRLRNRADR